VIFLRDYLLAQITGLAVYPMFIPAGRDTPAVVYTVVDRTRQATFSGTGKLVASTVNLDVIDKGYAVARSLADQIRTALVDFRGDMEGTEVQGCFIAADQDTSDLEPGFFRVTLTFNLWYVEN
jgi:hypothetical protein